MLTDAGRELVAQKQATIYGELERTLREALGEQDFAQLERLLARATRDL